MSLRMPRCPRVPLTSGPPPFSTSLSPCFQQQDLTAALFQPDPQHLHPLLWPHAIHHPLLSPPTTAYCGGFEDVLLKTDTAVCFCLSQILCLSPGPRTWQPPLARTLFPAHLHNAAHLQSCSEGRAHSPSQECRSPLGSMEPHRGSWSVHRSGQRSPHRTYSWSPE